MKSYCLKCRKDIENIDSKISSGSNGWVIILSEFAVCGSKNSRFIKDQEAKGLSSNLDLITPILGNILF